VGWLWSIADLRIPQEPCLRHFHRLVRIAQLTGFAIATEAIATVAARPTLQEYDAFRK
jgi:hypothetical protein